MPDDRQEDEVSEFGRGRLAERVEGVRRDHEKLAAYTEERFSRIERRIDAGFVQSQADRETGNKTLGDMIAAIAGKLETLSTVVNESRGAMSAADKMLFIGVTIAAAALGGWLSHL